MCFCSNETQGQTKVRKRAKVVVRINFPTSVSLSLSVSQDKLRYESEENNESITKVRRFFFSFLLVDVKYMRI